MSNNQIASYKGYSGPPITNDEVDECYEACRNEGKEELFCRLILELEQLRYYKHWREELNKANDVHRAELEAQKIELLEKIHKDV